MKTSSLLPVINLACSFLSLVLTFSDSVESFHLTPVTASLTRRAKSTTALHRTSEIAPQVATKWTVQDVEKELQVIYGHDRIRRLNAAMAKTNFLNANPQVDKRHMTYGEFPLDFFQQTLDSMADILSQNNHAGGAFVDLGSGVGRLTLAASLLAPKDVWLESIGIEIVSELHATAEEAAAKAVDWGLLSQDDALPVKLIQGDAFDPSMKELLQTTTALYAYSTTWECDDNFVLGSLSDNLANALQEGAVVAMTDRKLREPFVLQRSLVGRNPEKGGQDATSTINIYRLEK